MPLVSTQFCKSCQIKTAVETYFEKMTFLDWQGGAFVSKITGILFPNASFAVKTKHNGTEFLQVGSLLAKGQHF